MLGGLYRDDGTFIQDSTWSSAAHAIGASDPAGYGFEQIVELDVSDLVSNESIELSAYAVGISGELSLPVSLSTALHANEDAAGPPAMAAAFSSP